MKYMSRNALRFMIIYAVVVITALILIAVFAKSCDNNVQTKQTIKIKTS